MYVMALLCWPFKIPWAFSQDESFLIELLAKACTGAPSVLATAGWTWLSIRQSSVRNAGGGSAMISNSFGEEFGWQATKFSARNPTGRLNNFRRVPLRGALPKVRISASNLGELRCAAWLAAKHENLSFRPSSTKPCFRRGPRRGALLEREVGEKLGARCSPVRASCENGPWDFEWPAK